MRKGTTGLKLTVAERTQIFLLPLLLIVVAAVACTVYTNVAAEQTKASAYVVACDSADEQITTFHVALDSRFETLRALSQSVSLDGLRSGDTDGLQQSLRAVCEATSFSSVLAYDPVSGAFCTAEGDPPEAAIAAACCEETADAPAIRYVPASATDGGAAVLLLTAPVTGGQANGLVAGVYPEDAFRQLLVSQSYGSEGYSFVCAGDGGVVIRTSDEEVPLDVANVLEMARDDGQASEQLAADLKAGRDGSVSVGKGTAARYLVYRSTGVNGWMLFTVIPGSVIEDAIAQSARVAYTITATVVLSAILMLVVMFWGDHRRRNDLENEREDLHAAVEQSGRFVLRYNPNTDTAHLIGEKWRAFGYTAARVERFPERFVQDGNLEAESKDVWKAYFAALRAGRMPDSCDVRISGLPKARWFHLDGMLVNQTRSKGRHAILSLFDNTDIREKEQEFEHWRSSLSGMIENSVCYIEANLTRDKIERLDGSYTHSDRFLHPGEQNVLSDMLRQDCERNVLEDDRFVYRRFFDRLRLMNEHAKGVRADSLEFRSSMSGWQEWHRCVLQMFKYPYSDEIKIFLIFTNIHKERTRLERLSDLATRDSITHLLNRETTESRIRERLTAAGAQDLCAMFMIDLDNFKQVNDIKGHMTGDATLRDMAAAIGNVFRKDDIVGRVGGDEFMVFLSRGVSRVVVEQKTAALLEAMQFSVNEILVTASIGAVLSQGNEKTFEQLYAEADMALYNAKNRGKNQCCIVDAGVEFTPETVGADSAESVQFKTLLENMDGGVMLARVGAEIAVTYISPSFFRAMHRSEVEIGSRNELLFALVHPEDLPKVYGALRQAAAGNISDCTYRVGTEGTLWRHLRVAPIRDGGTGEDTTVIGVITDVTALKRSEQERDLAMERYGIAVKHVGGLLWEVDIPTRTLYLAKEAALLRGTEQTVFPNAPETLIQAGMVHPDSEADYRRLFEDVYAGREGSEYALLSRDVSQGYVWNRASFELLRDRSGVVYRAIGVSERITNVDAEMRAFAEEARFAEQTADDVYASAQANLSRGTVERLHAPNVADTGMKQEFMGLRRASALLAWCLGNMTDVEERAECMRVMQPDALIDSYRRGNRWISLDVRRTTHDGATRWTSIAVNLIRHPVSGDIHAFMYLRDCEARKRWEQAYAGLVDMDPQTRVYTEDTFRQVAAYMLSESRGGSQGCSLSVMEVDGLDRLAERTSSHEMSEALFTWGRLSRILLENDVIIGRMSDTRLALFRVEPPDAAPVGERLSRVRARIASVLQSSFRGDLQLTVGYEVEPCKRASIETMYRHAVSACFVAGRIGQDDPVLAYSAEEMSQLDEKTLQSDEGGTQHTVLIVDDNPTDRRILKHVLQDSYRVLEAQDGAVALDMLYADGDIALVLLDIVMPRMNGWEVLAAMRERDMLLQTPVIVISADGDTENRVRALDDGAFDILTKPYEPKLVKSRVHNVIVRQRSLRSAEQSRLYEMRLRQQTNLLWLAEHDELTGLLNRQAFYRRVRERLNAHPNRRYRIVRWDMDDFKVLNDAMGVEVGDRLLRDIAAAMRELCGSDSIYARLEADHFVDFMPADGRSAEDICRMVSDWFAVYPLDFKLTSRFGVYEIDDPQVEVSIMCDRALLALRSIKGNYSVRIAHYDESLRSRLLEEQQLSAEMAGALTRGEFEVFFQPQYNYAGGGLIGAEALVRWNHPVRGILSPDTFIPLFERNGFISQMDEYVWEASCRFMRKWLDDDERIVPISVAVNISRIDIYNPRLCENLKALTDKYSLPTSFLKLEITESAYMENPQQLISMVRQLRKMGFIVEMDDFGAGYSSLNTLKDVPVDILKLDVRFLSQGEDDARGGSILSSVVRMAHWLQIPVIAEGVETREQAEYLKSLNCFYMQGYLFGRPMPAAEFETLLHTAAIDTGNRFEGADMERMAAFWDASAQAAMLFNSYVGGAAILEYHKNNVEILRANDRFYREIRTTREAYADKQLRTLDRFTEEGRAAYLAMLDETIRSGEEAEAEVESRPHTPDGEGFWTKNRTRLIAINGESYMLYLSVENITDRKRMEEELRVSRQELQLAVSQTGRQLCHLDVPTRTLTVSAEYAQRHGIAQQICGLPYTARTVFEEDRPAFDAFYERIYAGDARGEAVVRFRPPVGEVIWEKLDFSTIFDEANAPLRAVISIEDVTAEKQREIVYERDRLFLESMGACAVDYDVLTDTLHIQAGVPGKGIVVSDVVGFYASLDATRYVHADSVPALREAMHAASETARRGAVECQVHTAGQGMRWCRLRYASLSGPDGGVYRIVGQLTDIQDEREREQLLLELGGTVQAGAANGAVVERVFTLLYQAEDIDAAIPNILRSVGAHFGVSRAYIFEDSYDHRYCSNTYEWCAAGVSAEIDRLQNLSYAEDLGGTYLQNFDRNGVFYCPDIETLPPQQRDILRPQGVRALLQCAILDEGVFSGYIGFDDCQETRRWTAEQVGTLASVSRIVGAFLIKKRRRDQAVFSEEFCAALDENAAYIYIVDPEDLTVTYTNRVVQGIMGRASVGEKCYRAFLGRDTPCAVCPVRLLREQGRTEAVEVLRPDGMWVLAQASPLLGTGREMMVVTCTDISALKQ